MQLIPKKETCNLKKITIIYEVLFIIKLVTVFVIIITAPSMANREDIRSFK